MRLPDGATLREHYENLQRQTGIVHEMLDEEDFPEPLWYLWEYFLRLNMRRTGNGYGYNAISNQEVLAWASLNGIKLEPFEVDALDGLERIFLSHHSVREEKQ